MNTLALERQESYFNLISELLNCPNGQEPEILDANLELIDSGLIQTMIEVATNFAHQGNPDGARFLVHVSRELAKQLGLYPQLKNQE